MKRLIAFSLLAFSVSVVAPASAVAQQLFVSGISSNDGGSCNTVASPCSSIGSAVSKVTSDGARITCLNTPQFINAFTISFSMSIDCNLSGSFSNIQTIVIDAPNKNINLRNLSVACGGQCVLGSLRSAAIEIVQAGSVTLDNVTVVNSPVGGIIDRRAGPGRLVITNSLVNGVSGTGIAVAPLSGTISALLDNVRVVNANYGLAVGSGARVPVSKSIFSGTFTTGVHSDSGGIIELEDVLASMSPTGVNALSGSSVSIANSRIISNNIGINGPTTSFGGNKIFANAISDGTPPVPVGNASTDFGLR